MSLSMHHFTSSVGARTADHPQHQHSAAFAVPPLCHQPGRTPAQTTCLWLEWPTQHTTAETLATLPSCPASRVARSAEKKNRTPFFSPPLPSRLLSLPLSALPFPSVPSLSSPRDRPPLPYLPPFLRSRPP